MTGYIMLGFCAWMLVGWVADELDTPALTPRHEAPASEGDVS